MLRRSEKFSILLIPLTLVSSLLGLSFHQPKFSPCASWNATGITISTQAITGLTPSGLFVDTNNTVYVANRPSDRILIWYDGSVNVSRIITGGINQPFSLFVVENGDIYFANGLPDQIRRITPMNMSNRTIATIQNNSLGLFVDTNNTIYCSIDQGHVVVKKSLDDINSPLIRVAGNGTSGTGPFLLNQPRGMFVDHEFNLYVADRINNRIQRFSYGQLNGTTVVGNSVAGSVALRSPTSVMFDADGYIFIADSGGDRIIGSGPHGFRCLVGCTGSAGPGADELNNPQTFYFDSYANIFVTDRSNNRIQKFLFASNFCEPTTSAAVITTGLIEISTTMHELHRQDTSTESTHNDHTSVFPLEPVATTEESIVDSSSSPIVTIRSTADTITTLLTIEVTTIPLTTSVATTLLTSETTETTTIPLTVHTTTISSTIDTTITSMKIDASTTLSTTESMPSMTYSKTISTIIDITTVFLTTDTTTENLFGIDEDTTIPSSILSEPIYSTEMTSPTTSLTTILTSTFANPSSTLTRIPTQSPADTQTTTIQQPSTSSYISLAVDTTTETYSTVPIGINSSHSQVFTPPRCSDPNRIGLSCNISSTTCDMFRPCQNNAHCTNNRDIPSGYTCHCLPGFNGSQCQIDVRPCKTDTCWNNGTCLNISLTEFVCICGPGWLGENCATKINYCQNITCQNKGVCRSLFQDYQCECSSVDYSGRHCEITSEALVTRKIVSKSFSYVAILAISLVIGIIILLDVLKYIFHIDPAGTYYPRGKRQRHLSIKPQRPSIAIRFVYVDNPQANTTI